MDVEAINPELGYYKVEMTNYELDAKIAELWLDWEIVKPAHHPDVIVDNKTGEVQGVIGTHERAVGFSPEPTFKDMRQSVPEFCASTERMQNILKLVIERELHTAFCDVLRDIIGEQKFDDEDEDVSAKLLMDMLVMDPRILAEACFMVRPGKKLGESNAE